MTDTNRTSEQHADNCGCIKCNLAKRVVHLPGCQCAGCKSGVTSKTGVRKAYSDPKGGPEYDAP